MAKFKNVISIHGAPRSGTSWLGQIFDSSVNTRYKFQPLFSYAFKDRITLKSTKDEMNAFYDDLYQYNDDFLDQNDKKEKGTYPIFDNKYESPEFLVTKMVRYHYLIPHLLSNIDHIKMIGIVRNPCGVMNSWRKAPREFLPDWDFNKEWMYAQSKNQFRPEEYYGFHRWKGLAKLFMEAEKKYSQSFQLVRYEDLVQKPIQMAKKLFDFTGLEFEEQSLQFLNDSTSVNQQDVYSVYKGGKDIKDWEKELDPEIRNHIINDLSGTEFERFLI